MKRQLIVCILVIASACSIGLRFSSLSSPKLLAQQSSLQATSIPVAGLLDQTTIIRDERGIPYIQARNEQDLYFAQGYATAADRLWQMDFLRRTARGELAEVLGAGPNNLALDQDKLNRTLGFAQVADTEAAQASVEARQLLDAYAKGVNAYIDALDEKSLPPEFKVLKYKPRHWTPADSLIMVKLFFQSLSNTWRLDVMREALSGLPPDKLAALLPETSPLDVVVVGKDGRGDFSFKQTPTQQRFASRVSRGMIDELAKGQQIEQESLARVGLFAESLAASNNWVVSGKLTASGKPLLSDDPHLAPSAPSIWHMVHLSVPGLRVAGVAAPGLPGVIIGHNNKIAWGFTNVGPDVQDVYLEKFDPANPRRYLTPAGWRNAEVRREEIKVRRSFGELATDSVALEVTVTRHGPIVLERDGKRYALRWTALDPKLNNPSSTMAINRASNWKEFTTALRSFTPPTQNIVYADTDGHIGYHAAGVVPIRKSGDGSRPYDGSKDDGEWVRFIPLDKMPHLFDPPAGLIVTANQRIVGADYPHFLTRSWAQPYRARRILDLLQEYSKKKKITADDFRSILGDVNSIGGVLFAKETASILRGRTGTPEDAKLHSAISLFEKWDGRFSHDSTVAPLILQMRIAFRSRILNAALGEDLLRIYAWPNFDTTLDSIISQRPPNWLPKEFQTYADLMRACYQDALVVLKRRIGDDESQWTWGNLFKSQFPHPLAVVPFIGGQFVVAPFPQNGTGGTAATVNVGAAVSMRMIADPSDWDKTQMGITLGQSGNPSSPHWKDQLDDWRNVTPRVFPFSEAAVASATRSILVLTPAK
jgi:penicillin amidase